MVWEACEGTGSLVIDRECGQVFAALSKRTSLSLARRFADAKGLKLVAFRTASRSGKPVYHTNIVLALLKGVAVVCAEFIADPDEQKAVLLALGKGKREVVKISIKQAEQHFCGNVLGLLAGRRHETGNLLHHGDGGGQREEQQQVMVLSQRAMAGFSEPQLEVLRRHCRLCPLDIATIEAVGGGSARCMVAEIFLPRARVPKSELPSA